MMVGLWLILLSQFLKLLHSNLFFTMHLFFFFAILLIRCIKRVILLIFWCLRLLWLGRFLLLLNGWMLWLSRFLLLLNGRLLWLYLFILQLTTLWLWSWLNWLLGLGCRFLLSGCLMLTMRWRFVVRNSIILIWGFLCWLVGILLSYLRFRMMSLAIASRLGFEFGFRLFLLFSRVIRFLTCLRSIIFLKRNVSRIVI